MGQQQLLLVILVVIIIGVATVIAMQVMEGQYKNSNETSVRQDVLSISNSSRAYYLKPQFLGGGGSSYKKFRFEEVSFPKKGISSDGKKAYNENGTYVLSSISDRKITVKAYPTSDDQYDNANPLNATNGNAVTAMITPDSLVWK